MADITEHHTEEEGEGHDGEHTRVDLPVARHTVGIDDALEGLGELIRLEVGGRLLFTEEAVRCT